MPSVVAFNAKGDSIAGLKAARVKSDGEKQVILGPRKNYGIEMIWNASQNNFPKNPVFLAVMFFFSQTGQNSSVFFGSSDLLTSWDILGPCWPCWGFSAPWSASLGELMQKHMKLA